MSASVAVTDANCSSSQVQKYIQFFNNASQKELYARHIVNQCGQSAIPSLVRTLNYESNYEILTMAIITIGHIGGNTAIEPSIKRLQIDPSPLVRKTAADALGHIRAANAIEPLTNSLTNSNEDITVRAAAAEALGNIGEAGITVVENALHNSDIRIQYLSVKALLIINSPKAIAILTQNQEQVIQVLEAADREELIDYDRVPPSQIRLNLPKRPIICKLSWVAQNWSRCR